jgi:hypothetical protein
MTDPTLSPEQVEIATEISLYAESKDMLISEVAPLIFKLREVSGKDAVKVMIWFLTTHEQAIFDTWKAEHAPNLFAVTRTLPFTSDDLFLMDQAAPFVEAMLNISRKASPTTERETNSTD